MWHEVIIGFKVENKIYTHPFISYIYADTNLHKVTATIIFIMNSCYYAQCNSLVPNETVYKLSCGLQPFE